jgi:hypothetical protein
MPVISGGRVIEGAYPRAGAPTAAATAGNPFVTGALRVTRARYDFAAAGGAVGAINLLPAGAELPGGAVVLGGLVDVVTPPTSGGAATLALAVEGAGDLVAAAAVSGAPWSTAGRKSLLPAFTGATSVKTTAARNVVATVATAALTAGVFDVYLFWFATA